MNFLNEAFKQLDMLSEDVFTLDTNGIEEMRDFVDTSDAEIASTIDIIDPEVEETENLADNYIGKIILECPVCHSTLFKAKEDVHIDEIEDMANMDEECPYCFSVDGYYIIGKVEPANLDDEIPVEDEVAMDADAVAVVKDDIIAEEPVELDESCIDEKCVDEACINEENAWDKIKKYLYTDESLNEAKESAEDEISTALGEECGDKISISESAWDDILGILRAQGIALDEDLNNVTFDTDDQHIEMRQEDSGKVVIETTPLNSEDDFEVEDDDFEVEDDELLIDDDFENGDEVVDALSDEDKEELVNQGDEFTEEEIPEDEDELEEFDEESFDEVTESYLRKTYGNIDSYKTIRVSDKNEQLIIEGYIKFNSGKLRKTNFILESKNSGNKIRFIGKSDITGNKNGYKVSGKINNKKFITESLNYNYTTKTKAGTSKRVYGTVKR